MVHGYQVQQVEPQLLKADLQLVRAAYGLAIQPLQGRQGALLPAYVGRSEHFARVACGEA